MQLAKKNNIINKFFVEAIKNKNDNLNVFEGFSINKKALINNKPKIGFEKEFFVVAVQMLL